MRDFIVVRPAFKEVEYNVLDFGAIEGGLQSNTIAFQNAIDKANANGGGKVIIPKGLWLTGPIQLKSNVNLYIEQNAYVVFDKNKEEYNIILTSWEGEDRFRCVSPISAFNCENIALTGGGVIDGSGDLWRPIKTWKITAKQLKTNLAKSPYFIDNKEGGIWFPTETTYLGFIEGEADVNDPSGLEHASKYYDLYRPSLVNFVSCDKVLIDGLTIQNSPAWNIHPLFCTNFTLSNCNIKNEFSAQNGDGLDLESCQNAEIFNTTFAVGDDGICVKSGKGKKARETKVPTKNVYIHDCIVHHAHGGFVVGSEMSRGVSNVYVEDCIFIGTDIGIRFKSAIGRGGVVEDIYIKNIRMIDIIEEAIIFTMGYTLFNYDKLVETKKDVYDVSDIPEFKNIYISNVNCNSCKKAVEINGLEEQPIHDITLENVYLVANCDIHIKRAHNIKLSNVKVVNSQDKCQWIDFNNEVLDDSYKSAF